MIRPAAWQSGATKISFVSARRKPCLKNSKRGKRTTLTLSVRFSPASGKKVSSGPVIRCIVESWKRAVSILSPARRRRISSGGGRGLQNRPWGCESSLRWVRFPLASAKKDSGFWILDWRNPWECKIKNAKSFQAVTQNKFSVFDQDRTGWFGFRPAYFNVSSTWEKSWIVVNTTFSFNE